MLKMKDWSSYQSYKDRKPPWIRFHKNILDNYEYQSMSAEARALLPMLWLLASEDKDPTSGLIRDSYEQITFRLRLSYETFTDALREIIDSGFAEEIQPCNETVTDPYSNRNQTVTPETETETETEKNLTTEGASHAREATTEKKQKTDSTDSNPDPPEGKNLTDYESKLAELQELVGVALIRKNRAVFDLWLVQYDIDDLLEVVRKLRKWYVRKNGKPPYSIKPYDKAILQDCNRIPTEDGIVLIADLTKKMKV